MPFSFYSSVLTTTLEASPENVHDRIVNGTCMCSGRFPCRTWPSSWLRQTLTGVPGSFSTAMETQVSLFFFPLFYSCYLN